MVAGIHHPDKVISVALTRFLAAREGLRWSELINADSHKKHVGKDLLVVLAVLILAAPIAMIPNFGLLQLLFGDPEIGLKLFVRPLPLPLVGTVAILILFPVSQAFAELPTYYGYVMPRLEKRWSSAVWAALAAAFWLGAQHVTIPFIPDLRFIAWRLGMFLPFALYLALVLRWRPRLLPYLMVVHALINLSTSAMIWAVTAGG